MIGNSNMKHFIIAGVTAVTALAAMALSGCVREELPDNRDKDYGYVQFKLYKSASYDAETKASGDYELDSLSQASKINVVLTNSEGRTISQTLTLTASDNAAAEFGLRSAKLRLLAGDYEVASYILYDNLDKELGTPQVVARTVTVTPGGLEVFDLAASVRPRGMISFTLIKDMAGFEQNPGDPQLDNPVLRVSSDRRDGGYTFDEIATMNISLVDIDNPLNEPVTFEGIEMQFEEHFKGDETHTGLEGQAGFQTSSSTTDTLVFAPAGRYKIYGYQVFDENEVLLETQDFSSDYQDQEQTIVVEDNKVTEAEVPVTLVEADPYIQDNYALFILWKALDGEHWSYEGQSWPKGTNWNFDKDPDLWCDQPGVQVHPNGRIASIDLSGFGISGDVPAAIGQFTELLRLSFGNHNETNEYLGPFEASSADYPISGTAEEKAAWVKGRYKGFAESINPPVQMSPACALALKEHGMMNSEATRFYQGMTSDEISRLAAGVRTPDDFQIRPHDMNPGKMTNNLKSIHENIKYLTRLESLTIANSPITADGFPSAEAFAQLKSVTELEIYNCTKLGRLPEGIARLGGLITVNISTNEFSGDAANEALRMLAEGDSQDVIQVLYFLQNGLTELPVEVGEMGRLGMLNVTQNDITGILPAFGDDFAPEELYFDYNAIEGISEEDDFCSPDALSTFTISHNKLTEFPNIFSSDNNVIMSSINVAHNNITSLPEDFNGLKAKTLTLSGNPIKVFPKELAETDSYVEQIVMQQCGMEEFPKDNCFNGKYSSSITTLDLQFNKLKEMPDYFSAENLPYLYGLDLSSNAFSKFPFEPLNILRLTAFTIRGQRDANGERCLREWPKGLYSHTGLRGFYIGSNDLRVVNDEISYLIYYLDISDNPRISFDASDICTYWQAGAYILYYDQTQEILGCDAMKY